MDNLIILKEIKQFLQKEFADNIKDVILFGLQASQKASPNSDYDILIILKTSRLADTAKNFRYMLCCRFKI